MSSNTDFDILYLKFIDIIDKDTMNPDKNELLTNLVNKLSMRENFKITFKHRNFTSCLIFKYKKQ